MLAIKEGVAFLEGIFFRFLMTRARATRNGILKQSTSESDVSKMAKLEFSIIFPIKNNDFDNHLWTRVTLWKSKSQAEKLEQKEKESEIEHIEEFSKN